MSETATGAPTTLGALVDCRIQLHSILVRWWNGNARVIFLRVTYNKQQPMYHNLDTFGEKLKCCVVAECDVPMWIRTIV